MKLTKKQIDNLIKKYDANNALQGFKVRDSEYYFANYATHTQFWTEFIMFKDKEIERDIKLIYLTDDGENEILITESYKNYLEHYVSGADLITIAYNDSVMNREQYDNALEHLRDESLGAVLMTKECEYDNADAFGLTLESLDDWYKEFDEENGYEPRKWVK